MRALQIVMSMAVAVILVGAVSAEDKKAAYKEKIVGTWEVVKAPEGWKYFTTTVAPGSSITMEFTKDGKCKFLAKKGDAAVSLQDTYSVDGDKLTITQKQGDKDATRSLTITKLTDKELVTTPKSGDKAETMEFKKK